MSGGRRIALRLVQLTLLTAAIWFIARTLGGQWGSLQHFDRTPNAGLMALAGGIMCATFLFLVAAWRHSLRWWNAPLSYLAALRIFFLGNLARYIPGTVWQFVSLSTMAVEEGVSPLAAGGAVLFQQVVLLATGMAITLAGAPELAGDWTIGISPGMLRIAAVAGLLAFAIVIPMAAPAMGRLLERLVRRRFSWPRPPAAPFVIYVLSLLLPWIAYGIAFWVLGIAFLGEGAPGLPMALTAYTASYVAGLIAVIAPGGIVVREAALVAALGPHIGAQPALLLAIASRLVHVIVELLTAIGIMVVYRMVRRAPALPDGARG